MNVNVRATSGVMCSLALTALLTGCSATPSQNANSNPVQAPASSSQDANKDSNNAKSNDAANTADTSNTSAQSNTANSTESKPAPAPAQGKQIETPYYTISLPENLKNNQVKTDEKLQKGHNGQQGIGCTTTVLNADGSDMLFEVSCFTNDWGPQGDFLSQKLGTPSKLSGWTAVILVPGETGSKQQLATYAQYVKIK